MLKMAEASSITRLVMKLFFLIYEFAYLFFTYINVFVVDLFICLSSINYRANYDKVK